MTKETQLYKKMSQARSKLARALVECQRACDEMPVSMGDPCMCQGCVIRKSIELALDELEV